MFIYSNHYLIVSKLTPEDRKSGSAGMPRPISSVLDRASETSLYLENSIISKKLIEEQDHFDLYKNKYFVHDKYYYSTDADPFIEFDFIIPFDQGFLPKEGKARDRNCKEYAIMDEPLDILYYTEEDLQNHRIFPKKNYIYDLNDNTYDYVGDNFNYYEDDSGEMNFIISIDCGLDIDSMEYWSEPLFVFANIREMHFFRKKDDHFKSSFLAVNSEEWFDRPEFDTTTERDNF